MLRIDYANIFGEGLKGGIQREKRAREGVMKKRGKKRAKRKRWINKHE